MRTKTWIRAISIVGLLSIWFGIWNLLPSEVNAQSKSKPTSVPQFKYNPDWPKPLPEGWGLGSVGTVCVGAHDHVFAVTRGIIELRENGLVTPAPPVLEFDAEGNLVNSFGDRGTMAKTQHGCYLDKDGNFWTAGNNDGIVQKYTHDGSKMLLQTARTVPPPAKL
jgi:hypothetical protein